jgi:hypothetical protein
VFPVRKAEGRVLLRNWKIREDMWNTLSWKWDSKTKTQWNGLLFETEVRVRETKERWTFLIIVEMESALSSNGKE